MEEKSVIGMGNSGNYNVGHYNSGGYNAGNRNSNCYNTGNHNSGSYNSGDCNSGEYNSGSHNSGLFNSCNYSSGIFCSEEPKVTIFNTPTDMTMSEFLSSKYYDAMISSRFDLTDWEDGKLIILTYKEACQKWWGGLKEKYREIIKSMPNFDIDIFCKITGINKEDV